MPEVLTAEIDSLPGVIRPTLLVVDDEEGPRTSLRIVFKDDYEVLTAENGESALGIIHTQPVDVAILDIRMAGMSGTELLEHIKQFDPGIEVIMLTAYETVETARKAIRSGACDYLNKPFEISTIRAAVAKAVESRHLSRENQSNSRDLAQLKVQLEDHKLQEEIARTRGEIYAAVIHDINSPLTVISGILEMLTLRLGKHDRIEGEDLVFLKDRLTRMTRQVHNCVEVSRRYLSFLREKSAEQPPVGMNQILTDLGERLESNPHAQRNQLIIRMLGTDAVAAVNGTDLMQILLNLILNALQCSPERHRVEISGRLLEEPLDLSTFVESPESRFINREDFANTPPMIAIGIADDGPGIPADVSVRLFETQLTTKPVNQGTGIGLSIVNRFIRQYRGAIHMATQPGAGTIFTVFLPGTTQTPDAIKA